MRNNAFVLSLLIMLCAFSAQAQRFGARAVLGMNLSQISGDQMAGFDKIGLHAGLQGTAEIIPKLNLNVEFLYSMRGSKPGIFNNNIDPDINITLRYIDLPVYVTYSDWYDAEKGYYKAYFLGGFSYGRLLSATTTDNFNDPGSDLDALAEFFSEDDFSWLAGFGFRLSPRFGLQFRYTSSFNFLLDAEKEGLNTFSLRTYFITLRGEFIF